MKKINKKKIIIVILITILIIAIVFVVIALRNKRDVDNYSENITDENDANIINQIKAEINSTADTNIYQVEDEYDGRHTLQIKPNIQFDTVLAGVLIEGTPANNEIDSILKNKPTNTGVWISKKSRDSFEKILIDNNLTTFWEGNKGDYIPFTLQNGAKIDGVSIAFSRENGLETDFEIQLSSGGGQFLTVYSGTVKEYNKLLDFRFKGTTASDLRIVLNDDRVGVAEVKIND